jgi:outer membrane protein assembly factor BamD
MSKLSVLCLSLAAVLAGCASDATRDETIGWSPNRIYQEAQDERDAGNTDKAVSLLERLEGRAAGTPLAQQAMLDAAYLHYKAKEPVQAIAILDRFMRQHPTSPATDYALYLKGLANFNDDAGLLGFLSPQDLSERDQKAAKDAFATFNELVTRFPTSKYASDARARMAYVVNSLAQSEVNVARYYYSRGAYLAAVARAQTAIEDYPSAPALEEALAILVAAYDALDLPQLRDDNQRVLKQNFPDSAYLSQGLKSQEKSWWKLW